jgi:putative FmdB family regulatory protein
MPIYEFKCQQCGRLTSIFTKGINASYEAKCQHCGGTDLSRAVSRFAYHKSEQRILEEYGEPGFDAPLEQYRDPRQIGRWVERRFDEFGIELPEESKRMIEAAREGEFPEPVKDL